MNPQVADLITETIKPFTKGKIIKSCMIIAALFQSFRISVGIVTEHIVSDTNRQFNNTAFSLISRRCF